MAGGRRRVGLALSGAVETEGHRMLTRTIPSTGESLPAVGLGTWRTFNVGEAEAERAPLREVVRRFFTGGARLIDSSPMYGYSEAVVGDLLHGSAWAKQAFLATKVWTTGPQAGLAAMAESQRRMGGRLDLLQVHNLVDWQTHLPALREWKAAGRIRYIGVTHYNLAAFDEMERILRTERVDFVQLPYSVGVREAEKRLLPTASDTGTAVIAMRPFEGGSLLREVASRPLPAFAGEVGAESWAQLLLKFILAHPAITVVIPAAANAEQIANDLGAAEGPLPDQALRKKIAACLRP
jgi:diketogulonate reductase-like aldo/keto reductase